MQQQQFMPRAPEVGNAPVDIVDRTNILNPADYWPEAMDCPDWPHLGPNMVYSGARGKAGAEQHLQYIGTLLNRGAGKLRAPTQSECEEVFSRIFKRGGQGGGNWWSLGLGDLQPLGRMAEKDAGLIVEACHIRGYLRKLEVMESKAAEDAKRREKAEAQHRLDVYNRSVEAGRAELVELAEAEARHKQRIEDERAFHRCNVLRQNLRHFHFDASQAAAKLGVEAPPMASFDGEAQA